MANNLQRFISQNYRSYQLHENTTLSPIGTGPVLSMNNGVSAPTSDTFHVSVQDADVNYNSFIIGFSKWGNTNSVGE